VDELADKPLGWVPHWPLGTRHTRFGEQFGLPYEATGGGKQTLYPEYVKTLQQMIRERGLKPRPPATPATAAPPSSQP
jgi:hypothetical protein